MKRKEKIYDLHFKAMEKFGLISETKMSKRNNRKEVPVLQMIRASDESRSSQNIVKMFKATYWHKWSLALAILLSEPVTSLKYGKQKIHCCC